MELEISKNDIMVSKRIILVKCILKIVEDSDYWKTYSGLYLIKSLKILQTKKSEKSEKSGKDLNYIIFIRNN